MHRIVMLSAACGLNNRRGLALVAVIALALLWGVSAARAGDSPGFHWGSDSNGPAPGSGYSTCPSSANPWLEPSVTNSGCGHYGAYFGEVGGYWMLSSLSGCLQTPPAWNSNAADRANAMESVGDGIGSQGFWFAAGPGLDPNYDGTEAEASAWGALQAQKAWALWQTHGDLTGVHGGFVLFMDVEEVGGAGDGWNEKVTNNCNSSNPSACCTFAVARHTVDGFINWVWNNTTVFHGVYSTEGEWSGIFGTGSSSDISGLTQAWTAHWGGNCVQPGPNNWTQGSGTCSSNSPHFFDGFSSSGNCALAWQWSGNLNQTGPSGDYDQVNQDHLDLCA